MARFIAILTILLLVAVSIAADDPPAPPAPLSRKKLELDKLEVAKATAGQTSNYEVYINKTYSSGDWNFFVVVSPKSSQTWEKTEIKIYKLDDKGNESLSVKCSETGVDSCSIGRNRIYDNDTIYIDVKCQDACEYDIKAYWSESFRLAIDKPIVLNFENDAYAKGFTLDLEGKEFQELRIVLTAQNMLVSTSPVHLLANFGKVVPTISQHDLKGVHLWDDGQGIFIKKADMMNQTLLTLLVEGPAENVLQLKAQLVTHHGHDIHFYTPVFDYLKPMTARTYFLDLSNMSKSATQDIIVRLSVFTGIIEANFFSDEKLNLMITSTEFGHMGDQQYKFGRDHLKSLKDKLYLKISSQTVESTFVITALLKEPNKPQKLSTELSEMSEIFRHQTDLYYIDIYSSTNQQNDKMEIDFVIHNFTGTTIPVFHICRTNLDECTSNLGRTFTKPESVKLLNFTESFNGRNSTSYRINLSISDFSSVPERKRVRKLTIAVLVYTNTDRARYSITNLNHVGVRTLRQNFPVKDRLALGQQKYYKIAKLGPDVVSVTIRMTEISGATVMKGYRSDPRGKELILPSTNPVHDAIVYKDKLLNDPIFIITNGQENSLYVLSLTLERQTKNSSETSDREYFNYIVVAENVLQELSIESFETVYIQIHPSSQKFQLTLDSSLDVNYCATTLKHKRPLPPNCGIAIKEGSNNLTQKGVIWIGITNPQNRRVVVKVSYTDSFNCEAQLVGHVWRKMLTLQKEVGCVKYVLSSKDDIEIVVDTANKRYDNMHVAVSFGKSTDVYVLDEPSLVFRRHELEAGCPAVGPCEATVIVSSIESTQVQVLMQYLNKSVTLLDGIAQKIEGAYQSTTYKHFKFHMVNKRPTAIIVEGRSGYYSFYVNIESEDNLDKLNTSKNYPTKQSHHFNSTNEYYTMYNTLYLTMDNLTKFNCTKCVMLITVTLNNNDLESHGKYIIEVTQEVRFLKEHSQAIGYLAKHSMALYEYYLPSSDRTMIISISSENIDCAVMYLAKGTEKTASQSHNIKKAQAEELVYKGEKGSYSIMVEAVKDCRYTISASSTGQRLYEINNGVFRDIKLNASQTVYFFYQHLLGSGFKILSLENYGELMIHVNVTNNTHLENLDNETSTQGFSWTSSKDLVVIPENHSEFCSQCLYLIVVTALKDTETSLIVSSLDTEIPLSTKRTLTDVLTKTHPSRFKIYDNSKELNISIEVHHGEVILQAISKENNETRKFKPQNKSQMWTFKQFIKDTDRFISDPIRLIARSDVDTMYTLFINSSENSIDRRKLKHGVPSYAFLSQGTEECYDISSSGPVSLILSTSEKEKDKLQTLKLSLKGEKRELTAPSSSKIVDNTMLAEFTDGVIKGNYTLCLQHKDLVSMTIIPVGNITILPQASSFFVTGQQNFSLTSNGKIILEVFECSGSTSVLFSDRFGDLAGDDSSLVQWRRFGANYLVETEHYGPMYLNVDGNSKVRWMHIDEANGEGIGYYGIRTPHFSYKFHQNTTIFSIRPLVQTSKQKLNFRLVNVTLVMSDTHRRVKDALQCSSEAELTKHVPLTGKAMEDMLDIIVSDDEIERAFQKSDKENFFVGVKARVQLLTKSGKSERYVFIYDAQELPWRNTQDQEISANPNTSTSGGFWSTLLTLLFALSIVAAVFLLIRFIRIKILQRKRERLLKAGNQSVESAVNDVELKYASFNTAS